MSHERRVPWTTWRDIEGDAKSPLRAALSAARDASQRESAKEGCTRLPRLQLRLAFFLFKILERVLVFLRIL